jgi:hypothetical protein
VGAYTGDFLGGAGHDNFAAGVAAFGAEIDHAAILFIALPEAKDNIAPG